MSREAESSATNDAQAFHDAAFGDVERELAITRRVLEAIPDDRFDWKPHPKSMSLGQLAIHVAYLPDWARGALASDVLDFATAPRPPQSVSGVKELLEHFDRNAAALRAALAAFDPAKYRDLWTLRNGDQVFVSKPRPVVYRVWSMNHLIHHRGQLCVYLRLLDVKVPTVYFNTADDSSFVFE